MSGALSWLEPVAQPRSGRRCRLPFSRALWSPFAPFPCSCASVAAFVRRKLATPAYTSQGDHERGRGCVSALGLCAVRLAQSAPPRVFHRSSLMVQPWFSLSHRARRAYVLYEATRVFMLATACGSCSPLGHPVCQSRGVFRRRPQDKEHSLLRLTSPYPRTCMLMRTLLHGFPRTTLVVNAPSGSNLVPTTW